MHEVRPALLRDREEGRVVRLVLVEVVHNDPHKQLQAKVDSKEDEQV